jgi:DNA-binding winged helix-turn-helix (wHTH) protein/tetratricopeptide (TPR) repeat protein
LLAVLLEKANSLVTREELRRALWPDDEYLDYDQGINTAVNRLRSVLRENPKNPQYLKTIPKRGYVFHGKVSLLPDQPSQAGMSAHQPVFLSSPIQHSENNPIPLKDSPASSSTLPSSSWQAVSPPEAIELVGSTLIAPASRGSLKRALQWAALSGFFVIVIFSATTWIVRKRVAHRAPNAIVLGVAPIQAEGGPEEDKIGESFRLSLIDVISQLPGVQVRAASAFANSKRAQLNIPTLSISLGLDDLLLGSVAAQGNTYDWRFELIRAPDAVHLASFEYSGTRAEFPSIRVRLQNDLFHYLQSRDSAVQSAKGSTNDAQAYESYLEGTYHTFDRSQESLNQAIEEFHAAVGRDPKFARAYAAMATACLKLSAYPTKSRESLGIQAQEYARQALRLDPTLAQAHAVLGFSLFSEDWDFIQGERELRYAISLDPTQADYRDWLSVLLTDQGRFDEAMRQIDLAHADDPHWPSVYAMEALMAAHAHLVSRSVGAGKKYVEMLPSLPIAHNTLGWAYFNVGQYRNAIGEWREMASLEGDQARVQLEDKGLAALNGGGIRAYARVHLDAIGTNRGTAQGNDFVRAEWYACAGKQDEALDELERTVSAHSDYSLGLAVNPIYDAYHHAPRFLKLLSKVGLSLPNSQVGIETHVCQVKRP